MCICGVAIHQNEEFPLIIISNRDEDIHRPAIDASLHHETKIWCGIDVQAGGTWCGANTLTGRFAVLTNFYECEIVIEKMISRGALVHKCLSLPHHEFVNYISENYDKFLGFNLFFGNLFQFKESSSSLKRSNSSSSSEEEAEADKEEDCGGAIYFASNRDSAERPVLKKPELVKLSAGIHGVANSYLDNDKWPKLKFLKNAMASLLKQQESSKKTHASEVGANELKDLLAQILSSRPHFSKEEYPEYIQHSLSYLEKLKQQPEATESQVKDIEEAIYITQSYQNNIFVGADPYERTRAQSIIMVHKSGAVHYFYRNTDALEIPNGVLVPSWTTSKTTGEEADSHVLQKFATAGHWKAFAFEQEK